MALAIPFRTLRQLALPRVVGVRQCSSGQNISVETDSKGIATLSMGKAPVNSLNLEFIQELRESLVQAESSGARGLVLATSLPTIFCAGLDITEMYQPDRQRLERFWGSLQDLWLTLYGFKLPVAAAITGHSPAGGCLLAMSCDYRAMVRGKFSIGLNETQLGIVAPFWFKDTMLNTVGHRHTEQALMLGKLYSAEEALAIGMVDTLSDSREECLQAAKNSVLQLTKIPAEARYVSKMLMRKPYIEKLSNDKQGDIDHFVNFITQPIIQKPLGMYLEALKNKSKKK